MPWTPQSVWMAQFDQRADPFHHDDTIAPGDTFEGGGFEWEVHAAPGHDPHSVVLFEPQGRVLISADALWENGFGVVYPELEGDDAFAQVGARLDLIEALSPQVVSQSTAQ